MCGRYSIASPVSALNRLFGLSESRNLQPRYNMAPTQPGPVVRQHDNGARHLDMLSWGLQTSWQRTGTKAAPMINARAETIDRKPSFRAAFRARRCLIPADGFFEWRTEGGARHPWRIHLPDHPIFAFAGLWENGRTAAGREAGQDSYCIATTEAAPAIAHIHHRMPVILHAADFETWLSGAADAALALLRPYEAGIAAHPVAPRIGDVRNDDPDLLHPYEIAQASLF